MQMLPLFARALEAVANYNPMLFVPLVVVALVLAFTLSHFQLHRG